MKKPNAPSQPPKKVIEKLGPIWAWSIPLTALLVKFVVIANIPGSMWLGADGESYLDGVNGLIEDGVFSDKNNLQYFPAGYPILIWLFSKISLQSALLILSLFQSVLFASSVWVFSIELSKTRIARIAPWISLLLSINPTLSLSSMVIGYESIVASLILITSTIVLRLNKNTEKKYISVILFSTLSGVMSFVQPRYLATSLILILVIFFREFKRKDFVNLTSIALIILILSPLSLGLRNKNAVDKFFVSNNLGITMNVGAGFESTGGYTNKATGVKCDPTPKSDIQLVTCVVRWYMTNPSEIARLSFNKTLYFFSPWSGPLANGTMARNPWQKINPVMQISKTPGGSQTIYGSFGKAVSWVWFVGQLALMVWGGLWLWRQGAELKKLSIVAGITIATSWLISLGTIGDHRFRLPVMGLMILLQVAGIRGLSKRPLILKPAGKKR